jgi:hypothetical protein
MRSLSCAAAAGGAAAGGAAAAVITLAVFLDNQISMYVDTGCFVCIF